MGKKIRRQEWGELLYSMVNLYFLLGDACIKIVLMKLRHKEEFKKKCDSSSWANLWNDDDKRFLDHLQHNLLYIIDWPAGTPVPFLCVYVCGGGATVTDCKCEVCTTNLPHTRNYRMKYATACCVSEGFTELASSLSDIPHESFFHSFFLLLQISYVQLNAFFSLFLPLLRSVK